MVVWPVACWLGGSLDHDREAAGAVATGRVAGKHLSFLIWDPTMRYNIFVSLLVIESQSFLQGTNILFSLSSLNQIRKKAVLAFFMK